jgi:hypothetical protein
MATTSVRKTAPNAASTQSLLLLPSVLMLMRPGAGNSGAASPLGVSIAAPGGPMRRQWRLCLCLGGAHL